MPLARISSSPGASFERLVDAQDERAIRDKRSREGLQEHTTGFSARPYGAAQDPMVAMEAPLLVQAHRTQGGTDGGACVPGARMAPAKRTRACCQARSEKSGAKGARICKGGQDLYDLFG